MRKGLLLITFCLALACSQAVLADPLNFNFSSVGDAQIAFNGSGGFQFQNSSTTSAGFGFQIGIGPASLSGLLGEITGNFSIGAIVSSGGTDTAPVTGSGLFRIYDGAQWFSAELQWVNISTTGSGSTLNSTATVNLLNFAYTGSNAGLLGLMGDGSGIVTLTFQFIPPKTLADLKQQAVTNSYSGAVASVPVPEPGTLTLLLLGLGCLAIRTRPRH